MLRPSGAVATINFNEQSPVETDTRENAKNNMNFDYFDSLLKTQVDVGENENEKEEEDEDEADRFNRILQMASSQDKVRQNTISKQSK